MTENAWQIYQDHLDAVSKAFWARDYDRVVTMMSYPHKMRSGRLCQVVQTPGELIEVAEIARSSMQRLGGTAYHRVCLEAAFNPDDPDHIRGRHRVFLLRGGSYVIDPYESEMCLVRVDGSWLSMGVSNENNIAIVTTLDPSRAERIAN
ncbi:hypothetical protein [Jannaschia formosa]|uniref:hypothetical protein n=1 Tax=Jannaschia formosa TaxID=2259592 RepID=UPI000E1BDBBA|nr:hypothetical protein [Jannaschia formosa]TFL16983.1 hypothetical protein DR046_17080 [Jannaschia formosa]